MSNTSEELVDSMLFFSSPLNVHFCIQKKAFGIFFFYSVMTLCFLIGTTAHSCYLWFYFTADSKNKQTQVFLLNYVIMELIISIACAPETLNVFIFNDYRLTLLTYYMFGLSWIGRPLFQTCICIEQYIAVIHPVTFLKYKHIKYKKAVAVTIWCILFGYGFIFIYNSISIFLGLFVFFIAMSVNSFCCVSVLRALKHPGPGDTSTRMQTGKHVGNQQKKNAFNTILSVLILILLTYTPQIIFFIYSAIHLDKILVDCNIVYIVSAINMCSVMITPFINMCKEGHLQCAKCPKVMKETL